MNEDECGYGHEVPVFGCEGCIAALKSGDVLEVENDDEGEYTDE